MTNSDAHKVPYSGWGNIPNYVFIWAASLEYSCLRLDLHILNKPVRYNGGGGSAMTSAENECKENEDCLLSCIALFSPIQRRSLMIKLTAIHMLYGT